MSQQAPPKIEFPCDYPIKVIGKVTPGFKEFVIKTISVHAPDLDYEEVELNFSRNGKFVSVRLSIMATGKEQLDNLFKDLKDSGRITTVL